MVNDGLLPLACHDAIFVPSESKEKYEELFPRLIMEEARKREIVRVEALADKIRWSSDEDLHQVIGNSYLSVEELREIVS